jgi:hypothetical protein
MYTVYLFIAGETTKTISNPMPKKDAQEFCGRMNEYNGCDGQIAHYFCQRAI